MRIHHLNCISTCPLGGRLMDGGTESVFARGRLACHCLLVETGDTLVLVDTGLGLEDVADPARRLSGFFLRLLSPDFREGLTARRQVEALGFRAGDVRHIVLTHLDFDHAGGLDDFPEATVHLQGRERDYAFKQKTWLDRQRFRPQQWSTKSRWQVYYPGGGEQWFGFDGVHALEGIADDILMVPLPGHTCGHCGVAVHYGRRWLLQAGDAYFFHDEMHPDHPHCTPGLRLYQWLMEKERKTRLHNQTRLRELCRQHGDEVEVFCSHDLAEFERLAGHAAQVPEGLLLHEVPEG